VTRCRHRRDHRWRSTGSGSTRTTADARAEAWDIQTDVNALPVAAWNHKVGERFGLALNSGLRNLHFLLICSLSRVMEGGTQVIMPAVVDSSRPCAQSFHIIRTASNLGIRFATSAHSLPIDKALVVPVTHLVLSVATLLLLLIGSF